VYEILSLAVHVCYVRHLCGLYYKLIAIVMMILKVPPQFGASLYWHNWWLYEYNWWL